MRLSGFDSLVPLNIDEAVLSSLEVKQRFYGQPLQQKNRLVLLYNKSLVAAPASSWEQIIEQTPFLLQQGILPAGVLFNEPYWFAHFATLFEPSFTEDQQPSLSTVPMQQALRFYQHLADMRAIDSDCSYDCVSVGFYAGKVAYSFAGVWTLEQAKQALGKNLGITDLPTYQGRPMHALASTVLMVYPNDSWNGRHQEAVRKFSRYLQSSAAQMTLAKATNIQPIRRLPQHETQSIPMLSAQSNLSGPVILMPANSAYVSIWNGMRKGLRLYQSGSLFETEAAAFMQRVAMRDLQSMERLQ